MGAADATESVGSPADSVVVGRIGRPHGLSGEMTLVVRTDSPERRFAPGAEFRLADGRGLVVAGNRRHRGELLLRAEGVSDRDAAEALRGVVLTVSTADLPPPEDPDEFHDHQLIGLPARLADGSTVGVVRDVVHGPAGELLVLAREQGGDALVPFVREIVPSVDLEAGLVLTPPDGLLDP